MEILNPNNIGYTLLGFLIGTLITGSSIVIILKCLFPQGMVSNRFGRQGRYRNRNNNIRYNNGRDSYRKQNSLSYVGFLFLLAFIFFAFTTFERGKNSESISQSEKLSRQTYAETGKSDPEKKMYRENASSLPPTEGKRYYSADISLISTSKEVKDVPISEERAIPSRIYIQKPASPHRETAEQEAREWALQLGRPVCLAFERNSSSSPYKILIGPYSNRTEAEKDRKMLGTPGLVLDISWKGWQVMNVNYTGA
ncbi:MAG: SPOR domain-containing protein [Lewinellaceae bacterium]|nr:SPOR domain-containing protein [Phaeodactylibacter sp.]MCB9036520.1 SPOR domain-containing protein [Lewinellaceae bacterium]